MVPPTKPVPLPRMVTGVLLRLRAGLQQLFLGDAAVGPQRQVLPAVDPGALLGQALRHHAGQREIDVVAAQQNVIADRDAVQREFAVRLGDGDQREVGGAAADIDDQDEVAHRNALAPIGMALDPGVEGRLRLFEQGDVLIAGLLRGFQGQFARHGVEGRGDGDQHLLRLEGRVGHLGVPGLRAGAPGSGGWLRRARSCRRLRARGREAAARCGRRRSARASSWPRRPGVRRSRRRASARGGRPRSRASRPRAGRGCRPGSRWRPGR